MKKICLIANSAFTLINFRREFILELLEKEIEVSVVFPRRCAQMSEEDVERELTILGVSVFYIPLERSGTNPIKEMLLTSTIYKVLKDISPDCVINYTVKAVIYGSIAAKMAGVPQIFSNMTGLGYVFTKKSFKTKVLRKIISTQYRLALSFNRSVFFQNTDDATLFISNSLVKQSQVVLIPGSGVDTDFFKPKEYIDTKVIKFLFVGRMLRDKGVFELINAFKDVKKLNSNACLSLVGGIDDNPSSLKEEILRGLHSDGVLNYMGVIKDKKKLNQIYAEHDVFVLPSYREGTPRSSLEAMSVGLAIITTNAPGCKETVKQNYNGLLVEPENVEQLKSAMLSMVTNREKVKNYGINSRVYAETRFDVRAVNQKVFSVLFSNEANEGTL